MSASLFVGTPIYSNSLHVDWVAGALSCHAAFPGRHTIEVQTGSFLPRQRDILTRKFFDSGCTHFLCVDSDIGWTASQAQQLLDTGKDFVSGIYCKKTPARDLPHRFNDETEGPLRRCEFVPGGFLLVSRPVIERMMGAYAGLQYDSGGYGRLWALWSMMFDRETPYSSEDVAFCRRWTRLGGEVWAHTGVALKHYGETVFLPNASPQPEPSRT